MARRGDSGDIPCSLSATVSFGEVVVGGSVGCLTSLVDVFACVNLSPLFSAVGSTEGLGVGKFVSPSGSSWDMTIWGDVCWDRGEGARDGQSIGTSTSWSSGIVEASEASSGSPCSFSEN